MKYFEALKNLFSDSWAFQMYRENNKRKLVKGLSFLPESIRHEAELVYFDIFPDTTRFPEKWEDVFGIFFTGDEQEKRRDILDSLWKINKGGQSAPFLEGILRIINDDIRIIENIPVKNPRDSNAVITSVNGQKAMVCGNRKAVNKYIIGDTNFTPSVLQNDISQVYGIPNDRNFWEMCFFVCKSAERNPVTNDILYINRLRISPVWKNYIEFLILKIKPLHSSAVLFIEWTDEKEKLHVKN